MERVDKKEIDIIELAVIGFRLATVDLGGQRIAAMSAFDLACKPGRFRLDGLCHALVEQTLRTAFDPHIRIHKSLAGSEN